VRSEAKLRALRERTSLKILWGVDSG
jgi:hypothetical protein